MAIKFDFLKRLAPKAADSSLEAAKAEAGTDIAAQALLDNLAKKEAEGAVSETPEAPAVAVKDDVPAAAGEDEGEIEIDAEGLADLLAEFANRVDALEKKEAPAHKEVDLAPVEEGFKVVQENFETVRKERDADKAELLVLKEAVAQLSKAVAVLTDGAPRSAQKAFVAQYRASEAAETIATKAEQEGKVVSGQSGDAYDIFLKNILGGA